MGVNVRSIAVSISILMQQKIKTIENYVLVGKYRKLQNFNKNN